MNNVFLSEQVKDRMRQHMQEAVHEAIEKVMAESKVGRWADGGAVKGTLSGGQEGGDELVAKGRVLGGVTRAEPKPEKPKRPPLSLRIHVALSALFSRWIAVDEDLPPLLERPATSVELRRLTRHTLNGMSRPTQSEFDLAFYESLRRINGVVMIQEVDE